MISLNWLRNRKPKRSTTIYNVISSLLTEEQQNTLTPYEKLQAGRKYIFNFNYPLPTNKNAKGFKEYFEMIFISKFCNRYFAYETFELWQIKLIYKVNSIMSGYITVLDNVLFSDNDNLLLNETKTNTESVGDNNTLSLHSDYPQNMLGNPSLSGVNYANSGDKTENNSKSKINTVTTNGNSFEKALQHSEHLKHIIDDLLNEFNELFYSIM